MTRRKPTALWEPSAAFAQRTRLRAYMDWLAAYHGVEVDELRRAVALVDRRPRGVLVLDRRVLRRPLRRAPERVLAARAMPGARWFAGATLSYPEHIFRGRDDDAVAIRHASELRPLEEMTWGQLRDAHRAHPGGAARARRRPRRPRRGIHAEHPRDGRGVPRHGRPRRGLVVLLAGLRRALGDRPLRPDRADGAARGRRLPLRRARLRPQRRSSRRSTRRSAGRSCGWATSTAAAGRTASSARRATRRSSSSRSPSTTRCASCTPAARPACRRRSSRATAASCSSSSSTRTCTSTCTPTTARSGLRRPAG